MKKTITIIFSIFTIILSSFGQSCFSSNVVGWKKFDCGEDEVSSYNDKPYYFRHCLSDKNANTNSLKQMLIYNIEKFRDYETEGSITWYDAEYGIQSSECETLLWLLESEDFIYWSEPRSEYILFGDKSITTIGRSFLLWQFDDGIYFLKGEILSDNEIKQDFTNLLEHAGCYMIGNAFPESSVKLSDFDFSHLVPYDDFICVLEDGGNDSFEMVYDGQKMINKDTHAEIPLDTDFSTRGFDLLTTTDNTIIIQKSPVRKD